MFLLTTLSNFTILVVVASAVCWFLWNKNPGRQLPPRAPGYIPILGHVLQLIRPITLHELFYKWSLQVGPVFTCYFGTQKWIIVNSVDAVKDLIVEKGAIYSSRNLPVSITQDIFQGDKGGSFAFMAYGPHWRNLRRIAHSGLVKNKIESYHAVLDERRTEFVTNIHQLSIEKNREEIDISFLIEHYTMTTILAICFGNICFFKPGDPILHQAFTLTDRASKALSPIDQIKEFFPFLQKLWPVDKTKYIGIGKETVEFYQNLLNIYKAQDRVQDCFLKEIIEKDALTDLQISYFIALFVGAGSETTTSTLEWAIAYLANHPDHQEKAYDEIKQVVGLDRLPESYDEPNLPYIQCIIHETLRIRPPAPTAIPHSTTEDDIYKDWFIPKNTIVLMNLFALHNDPERFINPKEFQPERHLDYVKRTKNNRKFSQKIEDRPHLGFSTGRRVCVGIHLAERTMYMALSSLLACFKIERVNEELLNVNEYRDIHGATWAIPHYKTRFIPRHDNIKRLFK